LQNFHLGPNSKFNFQQSGKLTVGWWSQGSYNFISAASASVELEKESKLDLSFDSGLVYAIIDQKSRSAA
jgi:hypothetical protein